MLSEELDVDIIEDDTNNNIEEDSNPIIEDTSKIDTSKLEVFSR